MGVRVEQVGEGWEGPWSIKGKRGVAWHQLTKGLVSPTKVSEAPGACGGFSDELCISSLQPVRRIDWAGLRLEALAPWEAVAVIQRGRWPLEWQLGWPEWLDSRGI